MVRGGRWSFGSMFKLGMGNIEREIDIDGSRTIRVTDQIEIRLAHRRPQMVTSRQNLEQWNVQKRSIS